MFTFSLRIYAGFCSVCLSVSLEAHAEEPEIRATLQAIAASAEANREAFGHGKCIFRYSRWHAASEADAYLGIADKTSPLLTRQFEMYFSGESLAIKSSVDSQRLQEEVSSEHGLITPVNILRQGFYAIDHDAIVNNAIVQSPESYNLNIRMNPFNLAEDSEATGVIAAVNYAESRKYEGSRFQVKQNVERDDRTYVLVQKLSTYNSRDSDIYLDATKGYLAFVTEEFERSPERPISSRMRLLNVREEEGTFFPMHAVKVRFPNPGGSGVRVSEMKVEELDLSYQPTPEDLSICFSKRTQFYDGINPNTSKTLYRDRQEDCIPLKCSDIAGVWKELQGIAVDRAKEDRIRLANVDRVISSQNGGGRLIVIANCVALAFLGLIFFWRRRKA